MAYHCQICGHKFTKGDGTGACPACGAFDVKTARARPAREPNTKKTKFEIASLVLLWSLFIYFLYDEFVSAWLA